MVRKRAVRLAQILASRSKTDLEETVLLITEQLGFRYFMFHGRLSPRRTAHLTTSGSTISPLAGTGIAPIAGKISCRVHCGA
jgi:hypothetical protein